MDEKYLDDDIRKCYKKKFRYDEEFLLQTKIMLYEKKERQNIIKLCFIQIAMFVLSALILAAAFVFLGEFLIFILFAVNFLLFSLTCIALLLHSSSKTVGRSGLHDSY